MTQVIYHRYDERKLTISTSNYPDEAAQNGESLAERVGVRIRSRSHKTYKRCYRSKTARERRTEE